MTEKELVKKEILYMQIRLFRMAQKKWNLSPERCADIFDRFNIDRYIREAYGFVSSFRYLADDVLRVFLFHEADAAWLHCVVAHRRRNHFSGERSKWRGYDILGGKIANDHTNLVITSYLDGTYGNIPSEQADAIAISFLEPENLKDQFCFRTKKALRCLTHIKTERFAL